MQICSNCRYKIARKGKSLVLQFSLIVSANATKQLYVYKASKGFSLSDDYFDKTLILLRQSTRINVSSNNNYLNSLINYELPNRIVFEVVTNPQKRAELSDFFNLTWQEKDVYIPNPLWAYKGNLSDFYFAILKRYFGVVFKDKGVILRGKPLLENSKLFIISSQGNINLEIQKNGQKVVYIDNIEYTNFNCLSYKTLANRTTKAHI